MTEDNLENLPAVQNEKKQSPAELAQKTATAIGIVPTKAVQRVLQGVFRVTLMTSDKVLNKYLATKERIDDANREARRKDKILDLQQKEADILLQLLTGDGNVPVEKFDDLETLSNRMNASRIVVRSLERLQNDVDIGDEDSEELEMKDSWIDRFLSFAASKNDPWREEILSACLEREARQPGSVSLRALWNVSMLEEEEIADLMDFVNLSAKMYRDGKPMGFYMVGYYAQLVKSDYVGLDGANKSVSDLFDRLEALDLFALGHGDINLMKANKYELEMIPVRYGISMADNPPKDVADAFLEGQNAPPFGREDENDIGGEGRYSLHAMPLTRAGNEIAALLDWEPSEDAIKRFEEALQQQGENLKAVGLGRE